MSGSNLNAPYAIRQQRLQAWIGQLLLYAVLGLVIAVFSRWPAYQPIPDDTAVIKLSLRHHGERLEECVELSLEELAKLPPNMRSPTRCPRERSPVQVELRVDDTVVYQQSVAPSGWKRDGAASIYQRLLLPAGSHRIDLRLNDDQRNPEQRYRRVESLTLNAGQVLVIDFDATEREVLFR